MTSPVVALVQLVKFEFPSQTMGLNTSNVVLEYDGVTYPGAAGLGAIAAITDGSGEVKGVSFSLDAGSMERLSLALDSAQEWPNTPATIYTALLDENYRVVQAFVDWTGFGDVMTLRDEEGKTTLSASAESSAVNLLRGVSSTYTTGDQVLTYAGDRAFDFIVDKGDEPITWPAATYFYK